MAAADRMTFGRAETTYFVPRDRVFELRARGETAWRAHLGSALEAVLAPILPRDDPRVWVIRNLDVDFTFPAEVDDPRALAYAWAREIARSLACAIRDGEGVTHFASRAAFLAQFAADVAAGRDTGCWYYESFASLRALPRSAVIREAIVREPEEAAAVLFELARTQRLEPVLRVLHENSARLIADAAFPASDANVAPSPRMIESLLALADGLAERAPDGSFASAHNAIRLCVALSATSPSLALVDVRTHVDRVLAFTAILAASAEPWSVVEALIDGDATAALAMSVADGRLPDVATIEFFTRLAATRPDVVTCAAGTLAPSPAGELRSEKRVASAFAGLALLLQPLAELEIEDDRELRRRIAAQCAIGVHPAEVLGDAIVELFAGPRRDEEEEPVVSEERVVELAHEVMTRFASRLFGFAGSSGEFLYANFIEGRGALREDEGTIVVELPQVPLEIILHLAGVHGRRFPLPWLPDRTIELRLGGAA